MPAERHERCAIQRMGWTPAFRADQDFWPSFPPRHRLPQTAGVFCDPSASSLTDVLGLQQCTGGGFGGIGHHLWGQRFFRAKRLIRMGDLRRNIVSTTDYFPADFERNVKNIGGSLDFRLWDVTTHCVASHVIPGQLTPVMASNSGQLAGCSAFQSVRRAGWKSGLTAISGWALLW